MPGRRNKAKLTGDTHPPEVEGEDMDGASGEGPPLAEEAAGTAPEGAPTRRSRKEGRAGKHAKQARDAKDKDGGLDKGKG